MIDWKEVLREFLETPLRYLGGALVVGIITMYVYQHERDQCKNLNLTFGARYTVSDGFYKGHVLQVTRLSTNQDVSGNIIEVWGDLVIKDLAQNVSIECSNLKPMEVR